MYLGSSFVSKKVRIFRLMRCILPTIKVEQLSLNSRPYPSQFLGPSASVILCVFLSVSVCLCLSLSICICLSVPVCPYLFDCLCLSISLCLSLSVGLCLSACLFVSVPVSVSVSVFVFVFISQFVFQPLSIDPSMSNGKTANRPEHVYILQNCITDVFL